MATGPRSRAHLLRARVGVAVTPDGVTAVRLRRTIRGLRPGPVLEYRLDETDEAGGTRDAERWAAAVAEIRRWVGPGPLTLSFALIPPLASTKILKLPPVAAAQVGLLIQRNAGRYFLSGAEPVLADARPLRRRGVDAPALAGCAAEARVEAAMAAAAAMGAQVGAVIPGSAALLEAARAVAGVGRGRVALAVCSRAWSEVITLEGGEPRRLLPVPVAAMDDDSRGDHLLDAIGRAAEGVALDRVLVVGDDTAADWLRDSLAARTTGPRLATLPRSCSLGPVPLAAFGAALTGHQAPQFVTGPLRLRRRRRHRQWTAALSAATMMVLAAAGALHLRGLHAELAALEAARTARAPQVAAATDARAALVSLRDRLESLTRLEEAAGPGWTGYVAALAAALPDSAYLVSFAGATGEIRVGGLAHEAHVLIPALRGSALFGDASFSAPLRMDATAGRERFELTIAVRPDELPPRPQPASPGGEEGEVVS
jgi:hypothetical protein